MSIFISTRVRRHNQYSTRQPDAVEEFYRRPKKGRRKRQTGMRKRRLTSDYFEMRKGRDAPFFERQQRLHNFVLNQLAIQVKEVPPTCDPDKHEWKSNGDPYDPLEQCLKCGMSFMRHIFTECP